MSSNNAGMPACWPRWCDQHGQEMVVWCTTCEDAVCRECAVGACGGHATSLGMGRKWGLATQVMVPGEMMRAVGVDSKANYRNHVLGSFSSKPQWRAGGEGGGAVLQGTRKDVWKVYKTFLAETRPRTQAQRTQQDGGGRGRGRGARSQGARSQEARRPGGQGARRPLDQGARGPGGQGARTGDEPLFASQDIRERGAGGPGQENAALQLARVRLEGQLEPMEPGQLLEVVADLMAGVGLD